MHVTVVLQKWKRLPSLLLSLIMTGVLILIFTQNSLTQEEVNPPTQSTEETVAANEDSLFAAIEGNTRYYLPMVILAMGLAPLDTPTLDEIGRPNGDNEWTVSWQSSNDATVTYQLQESYDPDFATVHNTYSVGTETSRDFSKTPSWRNVFYYRVRAVRNDEETDWSNIESVIGGYRDNFNNTNSGWAIRRTTYIEEVRTWYENGRLILQVEDSWDWGIASPMAQAPEIPYAIEYQSQPAHLANLVSGNAVFGADWPGEICPDYSTVEGVYEHDLCFNHFYNPNTIWYGLLKMAFERVDYLVWCPSCGGSPMKRLSDNYNAWFLREPVSNTDPDGWNTWRIEVRDTGLTFFVNDIQFAHSSDTRWVNEPYFGVFASTDEYSNSTWRFEYFEAVPLDD